jgi:hypothetical protein
MTASISALARNVQRSQQIDPSPHVEVPLFANKLVLLKPFARLSFGRLDLMTQTNSGFGEHISRPPLPCFFAASVAWR